MKSTRGFWAWLLITTALCLTLVGCQGVPVDGFNNPPNVWLMPACLLVCTSHLGKEDVRTTGGGTASGGGITSSSAQTGGN